MTNRRGDNAENKRRRQSTVIKARRVKVMSLKAGGLSDRQIAEKLRQQGISVSHSTVNNDWHSAIEDVMPLTTANAREVLRQQLVRLEGLLNEHYPKAIQGDLQATAMVLNILRHQRETLGLKKPELILEIEEEETVEVMEVTEDSGEADYSDYTDEELTQLINFQERAIELQQRVRRRLESGEAREGTS